MAASREHQGLIISLIIFVMLTVMMSVMSYVLYARDEGARAEIAASEEKAKERHNKADETQGKLNGMKKLLGFTEADTFEQIEAKWKEDMETYDSVYPDEAGELNYSRLVGRLASEIRSKDDQIGTQRLAIDTLRAELKTGQTNTAVEVSIFDKKFQEAKQDLETRTAAFATDLAKLVTSQEAVARTSAAAATKAAADAKLAADVIAQVNLDFERSERIASALKLVVNQNEKEATEIPDGAITSINQTTGRVYINVGRADSLRPQVTFSVHGRNVANVADAKPKAKIQVTRLLKEAHLAEARVVEEDIANPIIRGDRIFSPAWSPGRKIRFAFAGTIDMDNDGRSDLRRIRDLVAINNGIVDASPDANGDMVGKITTNTRYLVVGDANLKNKIESDARSAAIDEARANGVEQLSVTEFLDMMGWKQTRKTVRLGRGARGTDSANAFKPRRP